MNANALARPYVVAIEGAQDRARATTAVAALAWVSLGNAFNSHEPPNLRGAASAFEKAIAIDASCVDAHRQYALTLMALAENWSRTIEALCAWVAAAPNDPEARDTLNRACQAHDRAGRSVA